MKRFKVGLLAIVALVAMSFTLASNANVTALFDDPITAAGCYESVDAEIPDPLEENVPVTEGTLLPSETDCLESDNSVCCYRVEEVDTDVFEVVEIIRGPKD